MWANNGILALSFVVNLVCISTNSFVQAFPSSILPTEESPSWICSRSRCYNYNKKTSLCLVQPRSSSWACTTTSISKKGLNQVDVSQVDEPMVDGYDLTSPREWMEYLEKKEGNGGAYTVLRCDIGKLHERSHGGIETRVWGKGFHVDRIANSYSKMVAKEGTVRDDSNAMSTDRSFAIQRTHIILDALIKDAMHQVRVDEGSMVEGQCKTIMLTVLWTQAQSPIDQPCPDILVRGHSFCNNIAVIPQDYNPAPISATIALPNVDTSESLVGRYDFIPEAKLSSWCQKRKTLESRFKQGDGEVILARESCGSDKNMEWELLEGLTSNLFVVYKDGSIRTTAEGILHGYARDLIIRAAANIGIDVIYEPPTLSDCKNGLWDEMFFASSIRLLIPVDCLRIPNYTSSTSSPFEVVWEQDETSVLEMNKRTKIWNILYSDILTTI